MRGWAQPLSELHSTISMWSVKVLPKMSASLGSGFFWGALVISSCRSAAWATQGPCVPSSPRKNYNSQMTPHHHHQQATQSHPEEKLQFPEVPVLCVAKRFRISHTPPVSHPRATPCTFGPWMTDYLGFLPLTESQACTLSLPLQTCLQAKPPQSHWDPKPFYLEVGGGASLGATQKPRDGEKFLGPNLMVGVVVVEAKEAVRARKLGPSPVGLSSEGTEERGGTPSPRACPDWVPPLQ